MTIRGHRFDHRRLDLRCAYGRKPHRGTQATRAMRRASLPTAAQIKRGLGGTMRGLYSARLAGPLVAGPAIAGSVTIRDRKR
jgi:hypothetical protein